jgi:endonuclease/exonuclease/phosphatase family metal-dependent hydrolase
MTWNVENYVAANRLVEGTYRRDYPKPEAEKAALRAVVHATRPDVLALQEVGPEPYLEEFQRDLRREGLDYPHRAHLVAADPDRHVAVLSRRPLQRVVGHTDLTFRYLDGPERVKRGLLEVAIEHAGREWTIFVVHLKSRHTNRADDPASARRRAGEAEAVRDAVLRRFPEPTTAYFLVVGDCNDAPRNRPLRALQRRGRTLIALPVPAADDRGDTWTHYYRRDDAYTRVDYVLASPAAWPWITSGAAEVFDSPEVRRASDHRPVRVVIAPLPLETAPPPGTAGGEAEEGGEGAERSAMAEVSDRRPSRAR